MTAGRVVLYSVLGLLALVLLLLLLLLLLPVSVRITGGDVWRVRARVLGVPITLLPARDKPRKKKKPSKKPQTAAKAPQKKPSKAAQLKAELKAAFQRDGVAATALYLKRLAALAGQTAGKILRAITVDRLQLRLLVVAEESADTALWYARLSGIVYPAVATLERVMPIRHRDVRVEPGFLQTEGRVTADVRLHAVPVRLLWAILWFTVRFTEMNDQPTKEVVDNGKSGRRIDGRIGGEDPADGGC